MVKVTVKLILHMHIVRATLHYSHHSKRKIQKKINSNYIYVQLPLFRNIS